MKNQMAKQIGLLLPNGVLNTISLGGKMDQHTLRVSKQFAVYHRAGEASVVQDCSARHLAFSSLATLISQGKNKMNESRGWHLQIEASSFSF